MTGPTPAVVAAVMELEFCYVAPSRRCAVHCRPWRDGQCQHATEVAAAAERAALRAAADAWSDWDALEAPEKWLTDRAARVGGA